MSDPDTTPEPEAPATDPKTGVQPDGSPVENPSG